jgi:protein gp37
MQKWAPVRLDKLAATPVAGVRFASCEPLLGELDIRRWLAGGLEWVIAGGESGPRARPMHPDWARSLRDQCQSAGVPYFFNGGIRAGSTRSRSRRDQLHLPPGPELEPAGETGPAGCDPDAPGR